MIKRGKVGSTFVLDLGDGRTVRVKVWTIRGDKVELQFDASKEVLIRREEGEPCSA